jgi:hypothetical protein
MKVGEKKFFGIGAVVLLISIIFVPIVSSTNLNTNQIEENIKIINTSGEFCDLGIIINNFYLENIQLPKEGERSNSAQVMYRMEYTIYALSYSYNGEVPLCINILDGEKCLYSDAWYLNINLDVGESIQLKYDTDLLICSEIFEDDEERNVAAKTARLNIHPEISYDINYSNNNFDFSPIKHWKDNSDYTPTAPEILVSAPHQYEKIFHPDIPDLWYPELYNFESLPRILKSQRMGWIGQIGQHLLICVADIVDMFLLNVDYLREIEGDLRIIATWIVELIAWFWNFIYGQQYAGFLLLIRDFFRHVLDAIRDIADITKDWMIQQIKDTFAKLSKHANDFYEWTLDDPWSKPIKITGTIKNMDSGETATLWCRDNSTKVKDANGDKIEDYKFNVTSEPMGNERHNYSIHNCQVFARGSIHGKHLDSWPILSYAFANGTLCWDFTLKSGKGKDLSFVNRFTDKLKNLFKNRPIFSILENILERIKDIKNKENPSSIDRDYDLDALYQNVLEEQKNYEQYDVEYKEYYPGAPRDPNIVYYSSDQVIVGFKSYVDVTKIHEVEGYEVVDCLEELNVVVVEIYGINPEDFIEIVEQREDVEYAELNFFYQTCYEPNDPLWDQQWGPQAIYCREAWNSELGVPLWGKIAILDTGINYNHEDIRYTDLSSDYDFVNEDRDPWDDCRDVKHGTHCAGIASAYLDNNKGIAGVAQVSTTYIKVLDENGGGWASTIAKGIIHCTKNEYGIRIISMSLGGYGISVMMHLACDYAYYVKDVLIVAAAGNDGLTRLGFPARYKSVLSVGAVDQKLKLCDFSNYGPDLDLVAPGLSIISATEGNKYERLSGTSMATPHVAGVAALYFSVNPTSSAILCKGRLLSTATPVGSGCGRGLVNAYGAVKSKSSGYDLIQLNNPYLPRIKMFFNHFRFNTANYKNSMFFID